MAQSCFMGASTHHGIGFFSILYTEYIKKLRVDFKTSHKKQDIIIAIANARVHVTARLTARYREVLRTSGARAERALSRPHAPALGTAGSSLSRVASPPILARRATPPTGKHGPLPPALDLYAPRLSSLTLHSRAQRAPPPVRTCITCSCSWDRHENGNPHAVYSRGQGAAARADAPSPWRALPAQCAHDSARRGGWNSLRLVMTRLISVFRVPFE
jgi:hypothetical protein